MRIIFLNRYFAPDISATSQILSDLAFYLAEGRREVHVICSRQLYENAGASLPGFECIQGVYVHRVWTSRFGRKQLWGRAIDYASFYITAAVKLFRIANKRSVVVTKTDPPLMSIPACAIARCRGARHINWIQDVFPEVAISLGVLKHRFPLAVIIRLRDLSFRYANANVVLGARMADSFRLKGIDSDRLVLIPNWSTLTQDMSTSGDVADLRAAWGLQYRFIAMYSGNMGLAHEFNTILDAASLLCNDPNISFLWVGNGARKTWLMREAAARNLTSFSFQGYQPRTTLANSLSVGDVHLISLRPEMEGLIVPSKFYGILAVGRPVIFIGDTDGELARVIRRHDIGAVIAQGDSSTLVTTLKTYATQSNLVARQGKTARLIAKKFFDRSIALNAWERLLDDSLEP